MITQLEATRYRCFERLGVDVGDFRVLFGANGCTDAAFAEMQAALRVWFPVEVEA